MCLQLLTPFIHLLDSVMPSSKDLNYIVLIFVVHFMAVTVSYRVSRKSLDSRGSMLGIESQSGFCATLYMACIVEIMGEMQKFF